MMGLTGGILCQGTTEMEKKKFQPLKKKKAIFQINKAFSEEENKLEQGQARAGDSGHSFQLLSPHLTPVFSSDPLGTPGLPYRSLAMKHLLSSAEKSNPEHSV